MCLFNRRKPETIQSYSKSKVANKQKAGDYSELIQAYSVVINNYSVYIRSGDRWDSVGYDINKRIAYERTIKKLREILESKAENEFKINQILEYLNSIERDGDYE